MRTTVPVLLFAVAVLALSGCLDDAQSTFFPVEPTYTVEVTASSPSFRRDNETVSYWTAPTTATFEGADLSAVTAHGGPDLGTVVTNGMNVKVAFTRAVDLVKKEGTTWEDHHAGAHDTHHVKVFLEDVATGHHAHGVEGVPHLDIHVKVQRNSAGVLQDGDTDGKVDLHPTLTTHGLRYAANLSIDTGAGGLQDTEGDADGTTYSDVDVHVEIHEPTFARDHEAGEIWRSGEGGWTSDEAEYEFSNVSFTVVGSTVSMASPAAIQAKGLVVSISASSGSTNLWGESDLGIEGTDNLTLKVKVTPDVDTGSTDNVMAKLESESTEAHGRLGYSTVVVKLTNALTGGVKTVSLMPLWDAHHGFHYGGNLDLPLAGTSTGGSAGGGGDGHAH